MGRRKSKAAIDGKIKEAQRIVLKNKSRYDASLVSLRKLMEEKDEVLKNELLDEFKKSGKEFSVVVGYLREGIRK
jgi:Rad3-related DNA helicase